MPARKRRRLYKYKKARNTKERKNPFLKLLLWIILLITSIVFIFLFSFSKSFYKSKISIAINSIEGDIYILVFDPVPNELTTLKIPGSTQLVLSRQLGTWKAKSIWQLGENEGLGGNLLQETVIKNFHLPISDWADKEAMGFALGKPGLFFKAVVYPYKSSLSIFERLRLMLVLLKLKEQDKTEIDLSKMGFMTKTRLIDGEEGFIISKDIPPKIMSLFTEEEMLRTSAKVLIRNEARDIYLAENIGSVLEVMGLKVVSIITEPIQDIDCRVKGENKLLIGKISKLFSCIEEKTKAGESIDIEIVIGEKFVKRF